MQQITSYLALGMAALALEAGCAKDSSPTGPEYSVEIDPANFVAVTNNRYLPLTPGTHFLYQSTGGGPQEINRVHVTRRTRTIMGVTCTVVEDSVWVAGELVEATLDWYAQDKNGNVWYFGEDSKEFEEGGGISTEGSWEAGVDGALPGILMQGNPQIGQSYRQEYYEEEAEDMAQVLALNESVTVPFGSFQGCLKTKEWTPLEPGVAENKYYGSGVGLLKEVKVEGGSGTTELVSVTTE